MRGFYDFLRSRVHRKIGLDRTINSQTIRVMAEDRSENILEASGTAAVSTQNGQAGYAKGATYVKTDAGDGSSGVYTNIGTTSSADFLLSEGTVTVTLTATEIVGTAAGDIGHTDGATLVAAPGAGRVLEFCSAVLIYDYDTAAYTGGANDLVVKQGSVALTTAIAAADLLGAAGDKIANVVQLSASDQALTANTALSLAGTAYTQPGTAAGVLRVKVTYKEHKTGL